MESLSKPQTPREAIDLLQSKGKSPLYSWLGGSSVLRRQSGYDLSSWIRKRSYAADARHTANDRLIAALIQDNQARLSRNQLSKAVVALRSNAPVIAVSHQPVTLPYSGVYVQFLLASWLGRNLAPHGEHVTIWLCLDTDDVGDRRIRTAHLPVATVRDGSIPLSSRVPHSNYPCVQFAVPSPDIQAQFDEWASRVRGAYASCGDHCPPFRQHLRESADRLDQELGSLAESLTTEGESFAYANSMIFLNQLGKLVPSQPIFLLRMTTMLNFAEDEFKYLLHRWPHLSQVSRSSTISLMERGLRVDNLLRNLEAPAWVVCGRCGRREPVSALGAMNLLQNQNPSEYVGPLSGHELRVVPRVVLEDLIQLLFLNPDLMLTYAGGAAHALLSERNSEVVLERESTIYTWHPRQRLGDCMEACATSILAAGGNLGRAEQCLALLHNGRDSIAHLFSSGLQEKIFMAWSRHFEAEILTARMDLPTYA